MSNLRDRMLHDMQLHGYADRTQEAYLRAVRMLQQFHNLSPADISEEQLRDYFIHRQQVSHWSPATMRIAYSGIKFFYTYTLKREWGTLELIRAQSEHKLPTVLTVGEVSAILQAVNTPRNKAYLTVVYCCGLRLQEALHLQVGDIDSQRKLIHVHLGKGAKDRYVPLPASTLEVLRNYWKSHHNQKWVFPRLGRSGKEGPTATEPMNKETVRGALRRVLKSLPAITKPVRVHTWGRTLNYHPHIHFIVPGGGLSGDRKRWLPSRPDFFVHVKPLAAIYRAKFRDAMREAGLGHEIDPVVWRNFLQHGQFSTRQYVRYDIFYTNEPAR